MGPACFLVHVTSVQLGIEPITTRLVKSDAFDVDIWFFKQSDVSSEFEALKDDGVSFSNNDVLTFKVVASEETSLKKIDVRLVSRDGIDASFSVDKALFGQSNRKFSTLLFSGSEEVGTLSAELTLIKPLNSRPDQFMKSGPIWNPDWTGLEIGHCGAGQSYLVDKSANSDILENTILSLNKAAAHGADVVEFDVLLSNDEVPVLFHEFTAKDWSKSPPEIAPVNMFQMNDLKSGQVTHPKDEEVMKRRPSEHPFATLEDVFKLVDPNVSFNVELKYGMLLKTGIDEDPNPTEINRFVDRILKVVFDCCNQRQVFFSCFHPEVSIALRMKQSAFPVFQLQGEGCQDIRMNTVPMAAAFAKAFDMAGIVVWSQSLLRDPDGNLKNVREKDLKIFTYTRTVSTREYVDHVKAFNTDGVIFDRIHHYHPHPKEHPS